MVSISPLEKLLKNGCLLMIWQWSVRFWAEGECDFFHEFFMTFFSREKNSEKKNFRGSRGENSCIGVVWCVFSDVYPAACVRNRIFQSYMFRRAEEPPLKQKVSRGAAMFFSKKWIYLLDSFLKNGSWGRHRLRGHWLLICFSSRYELGCFENVA